ncbi:MAG TPA: alpha/beta fold hydrolase [Pyrinomonadaceae bacterium]|nr:alpha/beta fold hydrolase [Pyrinomonadaceae bacterium]
MSRPKDCFVTFRPEPRAGLRLLCFPYAGGGAHVFRAWAERLSPRFEVCAAQFPGRGARLLEEPYAKLGQLLAESSRALSPLADKPFAFFGHSMGALVCFELARLLRREGRPMPLGLFVSGRSGPRSLRGVARLSVMPEGELLEELRRFAGVPAEVLENAELMRMMLPSIRADFAACEGYSYVEEPPLPCPVTAFGGEGDPEAGAEGLGQWRDETAARFSLRMFPGGHFFLDTARGPLVEAVAQDLAAWLREARGAAPPA